jgi:GTP-binding protein
MPSHRPMRVAIVGRPNVGKSTLFNRLVGRRLALVDDLPGVTRDRREGDARLGGLNFTAIDTAGLDDAAPESLAGRMRQQTEAAVRTADVSLFVVDARAGITPLDQHFAAMLRGLGRPIIIVANKSESKAGAAGVLEAFELGLGQPIPISAEHGDGLGDLRDALVEHIADDDASEAESGSAKTIKVAIIGRPNAGKSTLINRMIGEERLLTGPERAIPSPSTGPGGSVRSGFSTRRGSGGKHGWKASSRNSPSPTRCAPSSLPRW